LGSSELWFRSSVISVRLTWASRCSLSDSGTSSYVPSARVVESTRDAYARVYVMISIHDLIHYKVVNQHNSSLSWRLCSLYWAIVYRVLSNMILFIKGLGVCCLSFSWHVEMVFFLINTILTCNAITRVTYTFWYWNFYARYISE